ncbi:corticotropin-releasing factor receptor 1-like protein [Labeo rohita]|uniref:Corticotropin-releasing factor receptor 1-like protein n=1 Tax=Labeo rohita TaxID=84645 RepID=A0A498P3F0_LABRO|nr:corticotropin-releasing factor receptor 1-like protein [Labeo rohita]
MCCRRSLELSTLNSVNLSLCDGGQGPVDSRRFTSRHWELSVIFVQLVLTIWITLISRATADLTCDALLLLSTNFTARTLILWNQTSSPTNTTGLFCNTSIDGIGTCWPRSSAGEVVSRPCPETFLGVRYNTTNNVQMIRCSGYMHN